MPLLEFSANQRRSRAFWLALVGYLVVLSTTTIYPPKPMEWALDNMVVLAFGVAAWFIRHRVSLSDASWIALFLFLGYHAIGSYYVYESMPVGFWLEQTLHLQRNPCDRIAHFLFGLLAGLPIFEASVRSSRITGRFLPGFVAVSIIGCASAVYEIFESIVVEIVNPSAGSAFLGAQGDPWDAQVDMAAALLGSLVLFLITARWRIDQRLHSQSAASYQYLNGFKLYIIMIFVELR